MKKLIASILLLLSGVAAAQTSPGLVYGQVPTAAQWNSYFSGKMDFLGNPIPSNVGGTGINNGGNTITVGGNFRVTGLFPLTFTVGASTSLTLPSSGTVTALGNTSTGSGSVVLSASPALTGTVTAATINATAINVTTITPTTVNATTVNATNPISVTSGGTGTNTLTGNGVVVMNAGGTAQTSVAASTSGNLLTSNGTTWTSVAPSALNFFSTGDAKLTLKTVADSGWVMADDGTIGSATSGATTRANADTAALYALIWNNVSNTWAAVSTGRGANAAADFAANKTIALTKMLGRSLALAGTGATLSARVLGQNLGEETHTLTLAEAPAHSHAAASGNSFVTSNPINANYWAPPAGGNSGALESTDTQGGGGAHNNMQPTSFLNLMIKL